MMLTEKDLNELNEMTSEQLEGVKRIMRYQIGAKLLVGSRDRAREVYDASQAIIERRKA